MTRLTLTLDLEDYVNPSNIRKIIKNIKGVSKVSSAKHDMPKVYNKVDKNTEWIKLVDKLRNSVNYNDFDLNDERTRYILKER